MKRLLIFAAAAMMFALAGCSNDTPTGANDPAAVNDNATLQTGAGDAQGAAALMATYEVTIENLTPATGAGSSQPFSPPILATHQRSMHIFRPGRFASAELAMVAEDAINGPLVTQLENSTLVHDVTTGAAPIGPGGSTMYLIQAAAGRRALSAVFMLVNTNDGFSGLDAVELPVFGERSWLVRAWDAGSEQNTELASDIPGPCCGNPGAGPDEYRRIRPHPGIQGYGDLDPNLYGWDEPVARIAVRRLLPTTSVN